ncbi:MAG: 1-deoxy-D-xylulose-5-phosphate synthase [Bacteroidales bacterium]|jgi:1-deoxy-D-xylulose-5-phosphate synthase|nr:1-deoxy-D-xylulose-5-phosphate synthase [Bacteroidales bacterium]
MSILQAINTPSDIKKLNLNELPQLCDELRNFIITETAENPGHLGSSLGTVELTVALHYVFDTPHDKLVWDVGHQAYGHKILTGRKECFANNRKYKGISGFPKMSESEYDSFGTGHSSTSVSAVLGMAIAAKLSGNFSRQHVAVIGDGAMGGGMAFEAMNQAGETNANLLIILNDNKIAIDKNVGAMSKYLLHITASPGYNRTKNRLWNFLSGKNRNNPRPLLRFLSKIGNGIKGLILRGSNMFQSLGFRYFGPLDGHDVMHLVKILQDLKKIEGPKLLHIITIKGKGLKMAEENQIVYHAPGKFDPDTGEQIENSDVPLPPRYQDVFGLTVTELAALDPKVVGITPAMATGCSLTVMEQQFPERMFDVGIAEQHAVTFAAGLAVDGYIPFCNIYSSFMQRGYDQLIHDVALQELPVIFCLDRAGLVGEDGATHHGAFDLAFLRTVPNMIIASPLNETELRHLLFTAYRHRTSPFAIRYPKGRGASTLPLPPMRELPIGKGEIVKEGNKLAILSIGPLGNQASKAIEMLQQEGITPALVNMRFLKPLDETLLHKIVEHYPFLLTLEDGACYGGLYSAVSEFITQHNYDNKVNTIALPDRFIEQGSLSKLYAEVGFDAAGIAETVRQIVCM